MSSRQTIKYAAIPSAPAIKHLFLGVTCCLTLGATLTACAATLPYNPNGLGSAEFARVSDICQNVMGLDPDERLSGGTWQSPRLDYWTSHYRGCIASLSDSLQSETDIQATQQADADCRSKGYKSDSPELALCVLQSANSHVAQATSQADASAATPISLKVPTAAGSLFYASPHETGRREQVACAALGLEPAHGGFRSCVKQLDDTLNTIDNPVE